MKLISLNEVCHRTSLSRTAINKHRGNGKFPKEVRVSENRIAFVDAEVDLWISERVAKRDEVSA